MPLLINNTMRIRKPEATKLMDRMRIVKGNLPVTGYMGLYEYRFGTLAPSQRKLIYMIWNGRAVDEKIISNFETLVNEK